MKLLDKSRSLFFVAKEVAMNENARAFLIRQFDPDSRFAPADGFLD